MFMPEAAAPVYALFFTTKKRLKISRDPWNANQIYTVMKETCPSRKGPETKTSKKLHDIYNKKKPQEYGVMLMIHLQAIS